jgi:hypothetical protein
MKDLAGALHVESALAGLVWGDAKLAAAAIAHDACMVDDCVRACGTGRHVFARAQAWQRAAAGCTGTDDAPKRPLAVTRCSRSPRIVSDVVFGNIDLLSHLPKTWIS